MFTTLQTKYTLQSNLSLDLFTKCLLQLQNKFTIQSNLVLELFTKCLLQLQDKYTKAQLSSLLFLLFVRY